MPPCGVDGGDYRNRGFHQDTVPDGKVVETGCDFAQFPVIRIRIESDSAAGDAVPVRQPRIASAAGKKSWIVILQVVINAPEKFLRHVRIPVTVRIRQAIACWRSTKTDLIQHPRVILKVVADIVQTQRMCQMSIQKCHNVTGRTECPRLNPVIFYVREDR